MPQGTLNVFWPKRIPVPESDRESFEQFLNAMSKRIVVGHSRYGTPHASQKYFKKLKLEMRAYSKTGNMEHLYNIANYAWLESFKPENKKFHRKHNVDSVTRGRT